MRIAFLLSALLVLSGCGKAPKEEPESKKPAPRGKSTMETLIDGATGRTAVRSGKKAEETIRRVSAQERKDLDDVLGE